MNEYQKTKFRKNIEKRTSFLSLTVLTPNYQKMKEIQIPEFNLNSDKLVEVIDEIPLWSAPFGLKLIDSIPFKREQTVLDIGFGAGFPLIEIAMRLGNSSKIYGIDPWEAAIRRTEKKLEIYGVTNVEIIRGGAEKIPLGDSVVDLITSNNGINNIADQDVVLNECSRVIKPSGRFVQTINLDTTMIEFYSIMEGVLLGFGMIPELGKLKEHIYSKRKPLDESLKNLEKSGFSVNKLDQHQFEYKFMDGTALLQHYFIRLAFLDSWKAIVPELYREDVFQQIEEVMNNQALEQGCIKLRVPFVLIDCSKK